MSGDGGRVVPESFVALLTAEMQADAAWYRQVDWLHLPEPRPRTRRQRFATWRRSLWVAIAEWIAPDIHEDCD